MCDKISDLTEQFLDNNQIGCSSAADVLRPTPYVTNGFTASYTVTQESTMERARRQVRLMSRVNSKY